MFGNCCRGAVVSSQETIRTVVLAGPFDLEPDPAQFAAIKLADQLAESDQTAASREVDPLEEVVYFGLFLDELLEFRLLDRLGTEVFVCHHEELSHGASVLVAREVGVLVRKAGIG